ncbi:MAG: hypothetical protein HY430_04150 [Candidatus Levybacteria bacterium]|nr:hypothetical protein [Candidatus Levybacteria bacterium]
MAKTNITRKLLYSVILLFFFSLASFVWVVKDRVQPVKKVHYHAGFIVVNNNKQVSFSGQKYMSIEPCVLDNGKNHEDSEEDLQREKAHLHDSVGDVVHVEREGAKWKDLFTNINYTLQYREAEAYINGKKVSNFQDLPIKEYDSLVVFAGMNDDVNKFLSQAVTKKHIQEAESKSEDCGSE